VDHRSRIPESDFGIRNLDRVRLYVNQAKFEAGLVLFPKGAPFLPELEAELLAFPQGKTDDQVDSISQALSFSLGYNWTGSWIS
jgi:predicted phage terminase large subunit-like protein